MKTEYHLVPYLGARLNRFLKSAAALSSVSGLREIPRL